MSAMKVWNELSHTERRIMFCEMYDLLSTLSSMKVIQGDFEGDSNEAFDDNIDNGFTLDPGGV